MRILVFCFAAAMTAVFLSGCRTVPKVQRVGVEEQIDLSGNWNDTDSRMVSEEMIKDALSRAWISNFSSAKGAQPRVIVGSVLNKSHEHINTETFVKDLERELINSGRVSFVASSEQRGEIRQERMEQAEHASIETAKSMGQEHGADFMVKGQINTILDEAGKTQLKYYQVELEMINILTNEKVWIGQKKIKKVVERPNYRP
ncbi:MAG: penicillin-binding protein activator LpoB [Elusimicrobia bacterium HGW-Elusimicrobia-1]|jgi:hypothetical protein|nr:MAG: penicillin-binding protein activator LpoB [Elusimicrobia bacterium HGW-Elusimicrobia-3]PKN01269.1 MAG: penicillin-binding protein activator LpoB [Elusimicrobia bacterium HGW-Elusimicrobia-1]